jgi:hypothetical protein
MKSIRAVVSVTLLAASSAAGAIEFHAAIPPAASVVGSLTVDNAGGGTGFDPVSVTGYSGGSAAGGQFRGNFWTGGPKPADSFLRFFCIELTQTASTGPNSYTASRFVNDNLAKLFDLYYPNAATGDFWNGATTNFGGFGSDVDSAAFQVAVWELMFDTDLSLTLPVSPNAGSDFGWVGSDTVVSTQARNWLAGVAAYGTANTGYTNWTLYRFDNERQQNYVSATYSPARVPDPGTLGLVALGLVALGTSRRRRDRA